jgi:excisionase family DNA binding protein
VTLAALQQFDHRQGPSHVFSAAIAVRQTDECLINFLGNAGKTRAFCGPQSRDAIVLTMTSDQTSPYLTPSYCQNFDARSLTESSPTGSGDRAQTKDCPEPMLTIADVASLLRVSVKTVRRMIESGVLKHSRFGRVIRISRGDLRECITNMQG